MEFETTPLPLDLSTNEKKQATILTEESFSDLNFLRLGSGAKSIIADIQTGLHIGAEQFTSAPFSVDFNGKVITSDITITGGSISGITLSGLATGSDINILGWTSDLTFSATDYRTVTWTSGTIKLADGTTFSIGTGNTGNMAALTYIYFDKVASTTDLQVTTTAATAVGANKILVAVAQNNSDTNSKATLQVFGGKGGQLITVDNIAANSASVNEFISNTAQIKDAIITNAKITELDVAKLTAGTITSQAITLAVTDTAGDVKIQAGKTDFGQDTTNGFILGIDDSDSNTVKFELTGGTITGPIFQTTTTGRRMKISGSSNQLQWLNGDSVEGYIYNDGSGNMVIDADNTIEIRADGTGDDIILVAGDDLNCQAVDTYFSCSGDWSINSADNVYINFTESTFSIREDGGDALTVNDSKDTWIADNCSAASFTDRTPFYEGDALTELSKIKTKKTKNGENLIDHSTLPDFTRKTKRVKRHDKEKGYIEYDEECRDLGATISMLVVAVNQLNDKIKKLENNKS